MSRRKTEEHIFFLLEPSENFGATAYVRSRLLWTPPYPAKLADTFRMPAEYFAATLNLCLRSQWNRRPSRRKARKFFCSLVLYERHRLKCLQKETTIFWPRSIKPKVSLENMLRPNPKKDAGSQRGMKSRGRQLVALKKRGRSFLAVQAYWNHAEACSEELCGISFRKWRAY